jgi:tetratricopeptide (TPR) repeat protein
MGIADRFTRREFARILNVTDKQLSHWEKLGLVPARKNADEQYDFRDLISVRTAKRLIEQGVPATRLRRSLLALQKQLAEVQEPLMGVRIVSNGRDVIVDRGGTRLEPISGQFVLNFDTRELQNKVRVMRERSAEDWFAVAVAHEANPDGREAAVDAYERAISKDARHVEALINLGMLSYEQGNLEKATECFARACEVDPNNSVPQFNLGSVLEELGRLEESRQHLRVAVRIEPRHADAHYNLAFVCDRLGAYSEGREHWQAYIQLDPTGPSSAYVRERLAAQAGNTAKDARLSPERSHTGPRVVR